MDSNFKMYSLLISLPSYINLPRLHNRHLIHFVHFVFLEGGIYVYNKSTTDHIKALR